MRSNTLHLEDQHLHLPPWMAGYVGRWTLRTYDSTIRFETDVNGLSVDNPTAPVLFSDPIPEESPNPDLAPNEVEIVTPDREGRYFIQQYPED